MAWSPSSCDASVATAAKISPGAAPRATSSATRRSAAWSSASAARLARACALAIAVATSLANIPRRCSAPAGSGGPAPSTVIAPQTRPSVMIGAPTPLGQPERARGGRVRARHAARSCRCAAARPERWTCSTMPSPSSASRIPTCMTCRTASSPHMATIVAGPSGSYRSSAVKWPPEEPAGLVGDGVEHARLRRLPGDQLGHAPQGGLLVGDALGGRRVRPARRSRSQVFAIIAKGGVGAARSRGGPRSRAGTSGRRGRAGARCSRVRCPSLRKMAVTCFSTVASLTSSACAMPALDLPSAIAASTARSRGVSSCSGSSGVGATEHPADHLGVERAAAGRDARDGVQERRDVADALLEQVADALGAHRR